MEIWKYNTNLLKKDREFHHKPAYHDHTDVTNDIPLWPPHQGNDLLNSQKCEKDMRSHHEPTWSLYYILVNGTMIIWLPCQHSGLFIAIKKENHLNSKWRTLTHFWVKNQPYRGYECLLAVVALLMVLKFYVTLPIILYPIISYWFISNGEFTIWTTFITILTNMHGKLYIYMNYINTVWSIDTSSHYHLLPIILLSYFST